MVQQQQASRKYFDAAILMEPTSSCALFCSWDPSSVVGSWQRIQSQLDSNQAYLVSAAFQSRLTQAVVGQCESALA